MFLQVIQGQVRDGDGMRRQLDKWVEELGPKAEGWLGSTAGVADDGTFLATARFESEDAARANSTRPEQGAWWEETAGLFDGEVTFHDCATVDTLGGGGSDDAGFVQVIQGRADRDRLLADAGSAEEFIARVRPDVLGQTMAWPGDGTFIQIVYFQSEADARAAEGATLSPEDASTFAAMVASLAPERFIDLTDPWLYSA
jgi:hypothetical protein